MEFNLKARILFLLLISGAVLVHGNPPKKGSQVYRSTSEEGLIGITEDVPIDNPVDNIFHVKLDETPCQEDKIWLVYDLDGVEDHNSVSRSVNEQRSVGGYIVKRRRGWKTQREQINAEWLRTGDNVIRFSLPEDAYHYYRIKNLSIEIEKGAQSQSENLITHLSKTQYAKKAYVKGFILPGEDEITRIKISGVSVNLFNSEFESLVELADQTSCLVDMELQYKSGKVLCHPLQFSETDNADFYFDRSTFYKRTELFFNNTLIQSIQLDGALLKSDSGSLSSPSFLSITTLRDVDLAALDAGMVNVTANHYGYRFLPHGTKFLKQTQLKLPYDPTKIPDGYTEKDIKTYYFDEQSHHWISIPSDTVDLTPTLSKGEGTSPLSFGEGPGVRSLISHFTDYINAIIKVPESPEVNAYNSTSMKGIKAANPTAAVNLINPPQANNTGSAGLSYPINIPAGRGGMQPQLAISYNSGGGNGWMGLGWNLMIPSIGIDTRWGVPRYDAANETETYSMNGEMLTPVAHRGQLQGRTSEKQFYPRVEGSFNKIVRHGANPKEYWWEVTDKSGTRYFYGGSPAGFDKTAVLRDDEKNDAGNVAHWALKEVRDLNGNTVKYSYAKVSDVGLSTGTVPGYQIYVSKVNYTGTNGSDGPYEVVFTRDNVRSDKMIMANLGFKQVTGDLLKKIEVKFGGKNIRHYELEYINGEFDKTLLSKINEFDAADKLFTTHVLDYYNDIKNNSSFTPHESPRSWTIPGVGSSGDFITHFNGFTDEATALSGTKSMDFSTGATVSIGAGANVTSKNLSAGMSFGYSESRSQGVVTMMDINGDGLPDKVYTVGKKSSQKLVYSPNISIPNGPEAFGSEIDIVGIKDFYKEVNRSFNVGFEAQYVVFTGVSRSYTKSKTSVYFADVNGDQLPDIVSSGKVFFNHLDPTTGIITFSTTSAGTPSPINAGGTVTSDLLDQAALEAERQLAIDKNPLMDVVRMWNAPYAGTVKITAPVQLLQSNDPERAEAPADGVRVAVQFKKQELWTQNIGADDYNPHDLVLNNINVQKGDRIFFRVGSVDNGSYDSVRWNPIIEYLNMPTDLKDANHKALYKFQASNDYVLSSPQQITTPFDGQVRISSNFIKPRTTDDVQLAILRAVLDQNSNPGPADTIWRKNLAWDTVVTTLADTVLSVLKNEVYSFKVITKTNIDWTAFSWAPKMTYTAASDPNVDLTKTPIETLVMPELSLFVDVVNISLPHEVKLKDHKKDTLTASPVLQFLPRQIFEQPYTGELVFSVKKADTLLAKTVLKIVDGKIINSDSTLKVPVRKGDMIFAEYHTPEFKLAGRIISSKARFKGLEKDTTVAAGAYSIIPHDKTSTTDDRKDVIYGTQYRGWGQFGWNGNREKATFIIDENNLKISDKAKNHQTIDNSNLSGEQLDSMDKYDASQDNFYVMIASASDTRWMGYDRYAFVMSDVISSSRLGEDDLSSIQYATGDGTGASGIDKITKTDNTSFSAGALVVSGSYSVGDTRVMTDFMDMNGDRYPDIVSEKVVQYTNAQGGLSNKTITLNDQVQKSHNTTTGAGLSGSNGMVKGIIRGKGNTKNTTATDAGDAKSSGNVSLSANASFAQGDNHVNYTYMDINGDGLPDRLKVDGSATVAFNTGYGFTPDEPFDFGHVQKGTSKNFSGGATLGLNVGYNSFYVGFSLARSENHSENTLMDINGDGLPDIVSKATPLKVRINRGGSFGPEINWTGVNSINENHTASESLNTSFTIGFTLWGAVKFTINPNVSRGNAMSREHARLSDMNGDGYPDFVTSTNDGNLTVSLSTIGRTNMLREVKRPLGASFTMNYHREGNTYDLPHSQWVLDEVMVVDGFKGDGIDTLLTTYAYEGGKYDRQEREFYGFSKVITNTHNTGAPPSGAGGSPVYTSVTQTFNNANYYEKGLLLTEEMKDSGGSLFVKKGNSYKLKNATTGADLPTVTATNDPGRAFPALTETLQEFYEGQSTAGKSTSMKYGYDVNGNVTTYTDLGDATSTDDLTATITYHNVPNLYLIGTPKSIAVYASAAAPSSGAGGSWVRKRESVIDNFGNVTQIKQFLTDSEMAIHDMEYDAYGNLKKITRPKNSKNQRLSMTYEYDATVNTYPVKVSNTYGYSSEATYDFRFGQVLESTDLNGNKITYELDDLGRVKNITGPYEKGGANKTIEFEYHPEAVVPWALTNHFDPSNPKNKMQTAIFVDGLGRVLQTKKDVALYDGEGKPDKEMMTVSGRIEFDAFGRTTKAYYPVTENIGTPGTFNPNVDAVTPTTTTYDVLNRTLTVKLPDGAETATEYGFASDRNGTSQFSTKTTDANGKQTEQFTDVRGRVTSVKNYTSEKDIWTSFVYNAINEQVEAMDDQGHATYSAYDNFGRRIERKHPDAGTTSYSYDLAGNLEQLVTANLAKTGGVIKYTYDFERLMEITYPENPENNVSYTYGEAGASDNRAGRIVLQQDASGAQEFFYGPLGEVVKNVRTMVIPQNDPQTYVTEWKYDTWNRLTSMTYADGEVVDYTYNVGGLLLSMSGKKKGNTFSYVKQLGYDKFEQRSFLWYGNGTRTTYNYEPDRRRLKNMTAKTQANRLFMDNTYTYDKVNNILNLKNNAPIPSTNLMGGASEYNYSYDDLYRLTSATGSYKGANDDESYTLAMSYNSVGGITQKTQSHLKKAQEQKKTTYNLSYVYGSEQPHAPVHIGDNTYAYDANGNQTGWKDDKTGQRRQIMWDEENRIRAIEDNGAFYHYAYDASGERVWKGKSTGQSVFVNGELKAGNGSLGNFIVYVNPYLVLKSGGYTKHYYIEGQRIVSKLGGGFENNSPSQAGNGKVDYNNIHRKVFEGIVKNLKFLGADGQILTAGKSGKIPPGQVTGTGNISEAFRFFYHPDHLGSTSYVTDATGEVYQHLEYFAFGETFVEEHSNTDRTPYLFNGKELDEETGLYYYGARYYDPRISVWESVDPMSDKYPSHSPYNYTLNSPINLIDPSGNSVGPPRETKVGKFFRNNMPGIIAAPLGGITDAFAGIGRLAASIVKGDRNGRNQAGKDILGGMLSVFGMKEILMERSSSRTPTSTSSLPNSLNNEMKEMQDRAWNELKMNPSDNGMHAWHAGSNAALSNKLGPLGGLMAWLGGIYHETPFDRASFSAEQSAQGTVNHILDSFTDIAANTVGMTIGLLLPKKPAKWLSLRVGNFIPGPGDPDPHGLGTGGYAGKPTRAWFNWWKNGRTSDNPNLTP